MQLELISCYFKDGDNFVVDVKTSYNALSRVLCDDVVSKDASSFYVEAYGGQVHVADSYFGTYSAPKTMPIVAVSRYAAMDLNCRVEFVSSLVYDNVPILMGQYNGTGTLDLHICDCEFRVQDLIWDNRIGAGDCLTNIKAVKSAFSAYTGAVHGNHILLKLYPGVGVDTETGGSVVADFKQCTITNLRLLSRAFDVDTPAGFELSAEINRCNINLDGDPATYKAYHFIHIDNGTTTPVHIAVRDCAIVQSLKRSGEQEAFIHLAACGKSLITAAYETDIEISGGRYDCAFGNMGASAIFGGLVLFDVEQNDAAITENIFDGSVRIHDIQINGGSSFGWDGSILVTGTSGAAVFAVGHPPLISANSSIKVRGTVSLHDIELVGDQSNNGAYWNLVCGWNRAVALPLYARAGVRVEGWSDKHSQVSVRNCQLRAITNVAGVAVTDYHSLIWVQGCDLSVGDGIIDEPRVDIAVSGVVADTQSKVLIHTAQETHYDSGGAHYDYMNTLEITGCAGVSAFIDKAKKVAIAGNTRLGRVYFDAITDEANKYPYDLTATRPAMALEVTFSGNVAEGLLPSSWIVIDTPNTGGGGSDPRERIAAIVVSGCHVAWAGGGSYYFVDHTTPWTGGGSERITAAVSGSTYRNLTGVANNCTLHAAGNGIVNW